MEAITLQLTPLTIGLAVVGLAILIFGIDEMVEVYIRRKRRHKKRDPKTGRFAK